jgi:hypothetical protein
MSGKAESKAHVHDADHQHKGGNHQHSAACAHDHKAGAQHDHKGSDNHDKKAGQQLSNASTKK